MKLPWRKKALTGTPDFLEALAARQVNPFLALGGTNIDRQAITTVFTQAQSASYGFMYRSQPAVRTTVDYLARNIAQLELDVYERVDDNQLQRQYDHPATVSVRYPNTFTPGQKLIFKFVADFLVYDNAYIIKFVGKTDQVVLVNAPPSAVAVLGRDRFQAQGYRFYRADGTFFDMPVEAVIHWSGYDPEEPRLGISKLETLRQELAADATARQAKTELDKAGLVPKGWIERPLEAAEWTPEQMERFREGWANWGKSANRKTPVLEDGMEFKQSSVSPEDAQLLESRKFTKEEVAAIYGLPTIPPENEEQRQQVYADVLPPYCEMLCSYLDLGLLQQEYNLTDFCFEFNLEEKQMGNERLKALVSATGRAVLLTNEARAMINKPPVDNGDELVTPLNVEVGDNPKPSVDVMGPQDPNAPPQDGSHRTDQLPAPPKALERKADQLHPRRRADMNRQKRYVNEAQAVLENYYRRQQQAIKSRTKAAADTERWNRELTDELHKLMTRIVDKEGSLYVQRLAGDDFDMRLVENYLKASAEGIAEALNTVTQKDIADVGIDDALSRARGERAAVAATSIGVRSAVFARHEAAKQAPGYHLRVKTWIADTDRHAEVDGETVGIDDEFSIGFEPGSAPNCACTLEIS